MYDSVNTDGKAVEEQNENLKKPKTAYKAQNKTIRKGETGRSRRKAGSFKVSLQGGRLHHEETYVHHTCNRQRP